MADTAGGPSTSIGPRQLYVADALVEVNDSGVSGYVCPVPCEHADGGRILIWPRPTIHTDDQNRPVGVYLDLTAWCVTYDTGDDPAGVTLPLIAHHQRAAHAIAEALVPYLATTPSGLEPALLAQWGAHWCRASPDAHLTDAQGEGADIGVHGGRCEHPPEEAESRQ